MNEQEKYIYLAKQLNEFAGVCSSHIQLCVEHRAQGEALLKLQVQMGVLAKELDEEEKFLAKHESLKTKFNAAYDGFMDHYEACHKQK